MIGILMHYTIFYSFKTILLSKKTKLHELGSVFNTKN